MTTTPFQPSTSPATGGPFAQKSTPTGRPATDRQVSFIQSLIQDKDTTSTGVDFALLLESGLTTAQASKVIDRLLECPRKAAPAPKEAQAPEVEDGAYALEFDGQMRFFHVRSPKSGRWEGYTFVDEQASDDRYPVRNRDRRDRVLAAISADPEALARYGQELGVCGRCMRTLTDEESRRLGIGPVCRSKV